MNAMQLSKCALALILLTASGALIGLAHAQGPVLKSSNPNQFDRWHGRAGGVTGSERIDSLNAATLPPANVSVTYDKDVAERTNMQRESVGNQGVGVTYDEAIADRTNMGRSQPAPSPVAKTQK